MTIQKLVTFYLKNQILDLDLAIIAIMKIVESGIVDILLKILPEE